MGFEIREFLIKSALSLKLPPSFSCVAERLLPIVEKENVNPKDIAEILQYDPGLAAKILNIANSAYYSRGAKIYSLGQAIIHIGLRETKNLLVCLLFTSTLREVPKLKRDDLLFIWTHSLFVALGAKILSRRFLIDDPEKVFTASLFHDIGKLVFFMGIDYYRENIEEAIGKRVPLREIELERYGITHNEIGYILARKWRFPESFFPVIKDHTLFLHTNGTRPSPGIMEIVNLANTFFYFRDIPDLPFGYVLKNELQKIEEEIDKFLEIMHPENDEN